MAGEFVLDTNVVIALLKGEPHVQVAAAEASSIWLPFIVLGELHFGARTSGRPQENISRIENLASRFGILLPDMATVSEYGLVRSRLKAAGKPIPEADLWIAALAIQHDLVLVSRDVHFRYVERLRLAVW